MNQRPLALILLSFCLFFTNNINAQWSNGQNATFVIGQPDFNSNSANLTQNGIDDPEGIAVDLINHKLYIADGNDHRILRYNLPITSNQPDAEIVFGQPNFTTDNAATTQNGLRDPRGLWVDEGGRLWVADEGNNRVIWYDNAYAITSNQPDANGVLGQPDFISNSDQLTQNGLYGPCDLVTDAAGNLWVIDAGNHRIIRYNTAALKTNGANADGVLGQADFLSNLEQTNQNGLHDPEGIAIGRNGELWVSDDDNHRVLRYNNAISKGNGANADGVLGQPNFTSSAPILSSSGMSGASGLTVDCLGNLYAIHKNYERLLIYEDAINKPNGGSAEYVLGQTDFTSNGSSLSQNGLGFVATSGVVTYENQLLIVDSGNKRIIIQEVNFPLANTGLCGINVPNGPIDMTGIEPIPTMSEWGLLIFGLLILNISVFFVRQLELKEIV